MEATGMADRVTAMTLERGAASKSGNQGMERGDGGATDKTASGSPIDPDNLVALVLASPEINELSDLNNRNIAIEEKQSAASGSVSAALMAAGAAEVQFSQGQTGALDRLISGEVPAAVLTLASPKRPSGFPISPATGFFGFRSRSGRDSNKRSPGERVAACLVRAYRCRLDPATCIKLS